MINKTQRIKTKANRMFTDREEYIETFNKAIDKKKDSEYKVINYYGLGGIGKSSLITQLKEICRDEDYIYASIDFNIQENMLDVTEMTNALISLRKQLRKYMQFNSFEIAYAIYLKKIDAKYNFNDESFIFRDEVSIVFDLIDTIGGLDVFGISTKILKLIKAGKKIYHKWYVTKGNELLHRLNDCSSFEILEMMPYIFAQDVLAFYEENDRKIVVFIDTYEELWARKKKESIRNTYDEWVRKLISELPEVLWIICGRDELRWGDRTGDDDWNKIVESNIVGSLSDQDANRFLISEGITDEGIISRIIQSSLGIPYNLDVNVDIYHKIIENGKVPQSEDFTDDIKQVYNRLIKHLSDSELATLYILAQVRKWNFAVFEHLVTKYNTSFPIAYYKRFCEYSFVENMDDGYNAINNLLTKKMNMNIDESMKISVCNTMFAYYKKMYDEGDINHFEEVCYYYKIIDYKEYEEWRAKEEKWFNQNNVNKFKVLNIKSIIEKSIERDYYYQEFNKFLYDSSKKPLLVYCGRAGIGKTVLKKQLIGKINIDVLWSEFDFLKFEISEIKEKTEMKIAILHGLYDKYVNHNSNIVGMKYIGTNALNYYYYLRNEVKKIIEDRICCIFMDSFELTLINNSGSTIMEELIYENSNIRWIVFSRDKLNIVNENIYEACLVTAFSQLETIEFLKSYGIFDNEIIDYVYEESNVSPLYIDMFAKYYTMKEKELKHKPTIEELRSELNVDIKKMIERLGKV